MPREAAARNRTTAGYPRTVSGTQAVSTRRGNAVRQPFKSTGAFRCPPTASATTPTVPQGTANAIPLTIAALSTPGNSYYANPLPVSGEINSTAATRTLSAVDPVHGPILTGATGLPISRIQINPGFTPPNEIPVTKEGEGTTNYPSLSSNFTGVYTFSDGFLRGFRGGGTVTTSWYNRRYYYYPNGVSIGAERKLFSFPTQVRFDLLLGREVSDNETSSGNEQT